MILHNMATCLGWTELEGCGECIIPLSDSYYISRLDPKCILFICKEILSTITYRMSGRESLMLTKSYGTCSGHIYICKTYCELPTTQLNIEYSKLVYIYTVGCWAACLNGTIRRRDMNSIIKSIIMINRMHDRDELWYEIDKLYKMLDVSMSDDETRFSTCLD